MNGPSRWLAVLAAGAALGGGGFTIARVSSPSTAAAANTPAPKRIAPVSSSAAEVKRLLTQTASLQAALGSARRELALAMSAHGTHTVIVNQSAGAAGSAGMSQLGQESAQLAGERQQLLAEQAQLAGEAQALAGRQQMLAQEATKLAALAKKLSHAGSSGGDGGGSDN